MFLLVICFSLQAEQREAQLAMVVQEGELHVRGTSVSLRNSRHKHAALAARLKLLQG